MPRTPRAGRASGARTASARARVAEKFVSTLIACGVRAISCRHDVRHEQRVRERLAAGALDLPAPGQRRERVDRAYRAARAAGGRAGTACSGCSTSSRSCRRRRPATRRSASSQDPQAQLAIRAGDRRATRRRRARPDALAPLHVLLELAAARAAGEVVAAAQAIAQRLPRRRRATARRTARRRASRRATSVLQQYRTSPDAVIRV